jgi:hypothetical protein
VVIRRTVEARIGSWKVAAVLGGLEHGSRGIAIVRSRYQATTNEGIRAGKDLACVIVICKMWRSAMAL